jgi:hypothetical protein
VVDWEVGQGEHIQGEQVGLCDVRKAEETKRTKRLSSEWSIG